MKILSGCIAMGWLVPIGIVIVAYWLIPDPDRQIDTFPQKTFVPTSIRVEDGISHS